MMWQVRTGAAGVVPWACPSFLSVPMPGAAGRTGADQPSKAQDHFRGLAKMIGTSNMSGAQGTHRRSTPPEAGIDARAALQGPFWTGPDLLVICFLAPGKDRAAAGGIPLPVACPGQRAPAERMIVMNKQQRGPVTGYG